MEKIIFLFSGGEINMSSVILPRTYSFLKRSSYKYYFGVCFLVLVIYLQNRFFSFKLCYHKNRVVFVNQNNFVLLRVIIFIWLMPKMFTNLQIVRIHWTVTLEILLTSRIVNNVVHCFFCCCCTLKIDFK